MLHGARAAGRRLLDAGRRACRESGGTAHDRALADRPQAITLGADKAYDAEDFINELRLMRVTPHVAQNISGRHSAIDGRTTRHGYAVSQRIRKRVSDTCWFGASDMRTPIWAIGRIFRTRHRLRTRPSSGQTHHLGCVPKDVPQKMCSERSVTYARPATQGGAVQP